MPAPLENLRLLCVCQSVAEIVHWLRSVHRPVAVAAESGYIPCSAVRAVRRLLITGPYYPQAAARVGQLSADARIPAAEDFHWW